MTTIEDLLHGSGIHIPIANHFSPGIASFYDGNFTVVDGHVKIKSSYLLDVVSAIVDEKVTIGSGVYLLEEGEDLSSVPDDVNVVIDIYGDSTVGIFYIRNAEGIFKSVESIKGEKGDKGVGISEIKLESSEGLVDTYVVIYDDGNTVSRFTVTNGKAGGDVSSVNGKIGEVVLDADDVKADPVGTAERLVGELSKDVQSLREDLQGLLDLDDESLNEFHEIGQVIRDNKDIIEGFTVSKVNVSDIVDNLNSTDVNKPLSAAQGKQLKQLIDNFSLTEEQDTLLGYIPDLKAWYDENHYQKMKGTLTASKASTTVDMGSVFDVKFTYQFDKAVTSLKVGGSNITTNLPAKNEKREITVSFYCKSNDKHVQGTKTYTIEGIHKGTYGDEVVKQTWTYNFRNKVYYGYFKAPDDTFIVDTAFIKNLAKSVESNGGGGGSNYATDYKHAGFDFKNIDDDDRYIWYAYPSRFEDVYGEPKFTAGGFEGGFTKTKNVSFTNDATPTTFTETYCVWHSTNPGVGRKTVVVE